MNKIPAAGVMHTSPVIIPWTSPMKEGFPKIMTSKQVHTRRLVAAQMLVFNTALVNQCWQHKDPLH